MNILILLVILSVISLFCLWFYSLKFARKIIFYNTITLTQIVNSILSTTLFISFFIISYILITNDYPSNFMDNCVLFLLVLFGCFACIGAGVHFTGKCLSYDLQKKKDKKLKKEDYLFHVILGHNITFTLGIVCLAVIAILNIYRPANIPLTGIEMILIAFFGFLWAFVWASTIIYAPITRKFYIFFGFIFCIAIILNFMNSSVDVIYLPYTIFYFSTTFFISLLIGIVFSLEKIKKREIHSIVFKPYLK